MMPGSDEFRDFEHRGWERAAAEYDRRFAALTGQAIPSLLEAVEAHQGVHLLDVACGPGHVAAAARTRGCTVLGIDFSSQMVALARKQHPELEFREGDAERLDLADRSFDAVVMNFGMLHLANPDQAIAEAWRVLRPGGRYAFTVWDVPEKAVGFDIVLRAIQNQGDIHVPLPEGPPFFRFSDPAEAAAALGAAGFADVRVEKVKQTWTVQEGRDLFEAFAKAAVRTAALLHAQTPEALSRIQLEIAAKAEAYRQGDRIELAMPAVLVSARVVLSSEL